MATNFRQSSISGSYEVWNLKTWGQMCEIEIEDPESVHARAG